MIMSYVIITMHAVKDLNLYIFALLFYVHLILLNIIIPQNYLKFKTLKEYYLFNAKHFPTIAKAITLITNTANTNSIFS